MTGPYTIALIGDNRYLGYVSFGNYDIQSIYCAKFYP